MGRSRYMMSWIYYIVHCINVFLTCRKKERKKKEERNKEKKKKRRKEKKTEHNTCLSDLKSVVDSRLKGNLGHPQFCPDKDSEASVRILCWQTKQKKKRGDIAQSWKKRRAILWIPGMVPPVLSPARIRQELWKVPWYKTGDMVGQVTSSKWRVH